MISRTRLLIVDDDPSVREMLREYLVGHGFEVAEAGSGAQMREQFERELPDAVLLDVRLPGDDGLVLARYLREHYDVGIIMVTASGDVVDRVVGLEIGADDYIAKPFDPRELLARIKSVLRRIQAKPEAPAAAQPQQPAPAAAVPGLADQINQLAMLRDQGHLTEAEFQAKKAELLGRM
jgi:two-component system phosphate regulon response regulator OmpR